MKFKLTNCDHFPKEDYAKKLETLGFKFKPCNDVYFKSQGRLEPDSWDDNSKISIEINSLEELIAFVRKWGQIVLYEDEINIYDDYRE